MFTPNFTGLFYPHQISKYLSHSYSCDESSLDIEPACRFHNVISQTRRGKHNWRIMATISINDTSLENKVTYYHISVTLPLRSISVARRYSEFVSLVENLCSEIGISQRDFPYPLPPKGGLFNNSTKIVAERKVKLTEFLSNIVRDRDLQNRDSVHKFLGLPVSFRFTPELFKENQQDESSAKFLIDDDVADINKGQWLSYLRIVRFNASDMGKGTDLASKLAARENANKFIRPNLEKLSLSLQHLSKSGAIDHGEYSKRNNMLKEIQADVEKVVRGEAPKVSNLPESSLRRIFAKRDDTPPEETNTTLALNNKELLQQQKLMHQQQDQELEQLRMVIGRQRQIGEAINKEVEEQNEILDRFSNEVEASSQKVQTARTRTRRIG